ncbi:MAG: alanine racemase, partial [Burkholderiales bacterium]
MSRPVHAVIDLRALHNNVVVARRHAGDARLIAVVKADAYGHGLANVLPALGDTDAIAVVEFESAVFARARGYGKPIVLLEGFFSPGELSRFSELSLTAVIYQREQVEMLRVARLKRVIDVHVKLNSGMNRLGFRPDELAAVVAALRASGNVGEITAMTHFADADGKHGIEWQLERFNAAAAAQGLPSSMANSAALLRYPQARGSWVRPGIMLYGASPFAELTANSLSLQPVMTLQSRIIAIQDLAPGDTVGYSRTYTARKAMRIGVVACGYG